MAGTTIGELHEACKRDGLRLALDLVGPVGERARDREVAYVYSLRLRATSTGGLVLAGKCQSEPQRESVDELAAGVSEILRRKGFIRP